MYEKSFETVCRYGELKYKRREQVDPKKSKAKDMSHQYFYNHWTKNKLMVLFEGEKRALRGYQKTEVCWICVDEFGGLHSVPARHLRMMDCLCGFGFVPGVWEAMFELLDWAEKKDGK